MQRLKPPYSFDRRSMFDSYLLQKPAIQKFYLSL